LAFSGKSQGDFQALEVGEIAVRFLIPRRAGGAADAREASEGRRKCGVDASRPPRRPPEFRAILGMTSALPVLGPLPRLRGPAQARRAGQSGFSTGFLVRLDWINVPRVAPGRYPRRPPSSGDPLLEPNGTGPAHPGRMA
jgi:hypothetical protein